MFTFTTSKKQEIPLHYILYITAAFELNTVRTLVEQHLATANTGEFLVKKSNDHLVFHTQIKQQPKKNKISYIAYKIQKTANTIQITSHEVVEDCKEGTEKKTPRNLYKKDIAIRTVITDYINSLLTATAYTLNSTKNEYNVPLTPEAKNYILYHIQPEEWVLSCLEITNVKIKGTVIANTSEDFLILTSKRTLVFRNAEPEYSIIDLSEEAFVYEEKIGKDRIHSDSITCTTTLLNDSLMESLKPCIEMLTKDRIAQFADILFLKQGTKIAYQEWSIALYQKASEETSPLKNKVKALLVPIVKTLGDTEVPSNIPALDQLAFDQEDFGWVLYTICDDWELNSTEQLQLLHYFTTQYTAIQLQYLAVFYDRVIADIAMQKKQPETWFTIQLEHLVYLKETQQYQKAIPFYEHAIAHLADDSILPLLSDQHTNLFLGEDVNPIRIQLLEDLVHIKRQAGESYAATLVTLAALQPLVFDRLLQLIEEGIEVEKANHILSLFQKDMLTPTPLESAIVPSSQYTTQYLVDSVTPSCFKQTKGFMDNLRQMIAQIDPPDYTQVTSFSETITATNYPEVYEIITTTATRLSMEIPECYLGRGDFETGIIGVEGNPNFLIIGTAHLNPIHAAYVSLAELQFLIAVELAHIVFEHTRITAKDVWRGAKNKGLNIAETLLVALPIVSSVGAIASKFIDVSKIATVFQGVEKFTNIIDKGQTAITYGDKINEQFNKSKKDTNLLATSRLMEISADRVGLLMHMDLRSSIAAIFKIEPIYEQLKDEIQKKGLQTVLSMQDTDETFIYQEYTIRLKTLCSFYLTYDETRTT